MSRKRRPMTPAEVMRRLEAEGWVGRAGRGDHRVYTKPGRAFAVVVDASAREIPIGTLRSIFRAAGWSW